MSELPNEDTEAIKRIHNRWIRAELAGNNLETIELCTDDVIWIPPDAPPLSGKETIAQYLNENRIELREVTTTDVLIRGSASLAYLIGNYCSRFVTYGTTNVEEATGTHFWILRKTGPGVWRVAVVAWNSWHPRS